MKNIIGVLNATAYGIKLIRGVMNVKLGFVVKEDI
jgi:hypothetical protein